MNITEIMRALELSDSDIDCILNTEKKFGEEVRKIVDEYYDGKLEYKESVDKVSEIQTGDISMHSVHMLYIICCSEVLCEKYKSKNLPESLFVNSMTDIKYKLEECKSVYDVCGIFATKWYGGFFEMMRFAHGRLQYDYKEFEFEDWNFGGITVKKGDTVLGCHIPSAGPLTEESVIDSLKKAYEFNKDMDFVKKHGVLPVMCGSWLLYPKYKEVFGKNSNTTRFAEMFDVFKVVECESFDSGWRVFKKSWGQETEKLYEDTTMQRSFKKWILEGGSHGVAYGMLFFDGEKIVNGRNS